MDFHFASILSTMHNIAMAVHSKKKTTPSKVSDFLVNWHGDKEEDNAMSPEQIKQFFINMRDQQERQKVREEQRAQRRMRTKQK